MPYEGSRNIESTIHSAAASFAWKEPQTRAATMRTVAHALEEAQTTILESASSETNLTIDELRPEFDRMVGTIRMFADLVAEGSWVRAAIDRPVQPPTKSIGPNHDIRSMLRPLGAVVAVFGASNFPLAYGACGGDTASAWAAGCGVVVKEHPGHPKTGRLLAHIAREAFWKTETPAGLLGYLQDDESGGFGVAKALVQHPLVCAVGFTGSIPGGLAIEKLARERDIPIPVFAEMSSVNPVIVTGAALKQRGPKIAQEIAASMLARYGQQCTCPGMILLDTPEDPPFEDALRDVVQQAKVRPMLTPRVHDHFVQRVDEVEHSASEGVDVLARTTSERAHEGPVVFVVDGSERLRESEGLTKELFGPAGILLHANLMAYEPLDIVDKLKGQLTVSIYTGPSDQEPGEVDIMIEHLTASVGRLIFNGPPTGVRVATAMVHGGPFPATNRPEMTAVGPLAIERWCRRICYQNAPSAFLPQELLDDNPLKISRIEDGVLVSSRSATAPVT